MTTTRQQTGKAGGYGGVPTSERIPSCGIEDVDQAMFKAFDKDLGFNVINQNNETIPVRTIFAAGERWNQVKSRPQLRDENGSLILPLIAITRTNIAQNASEDITGRGINQQTGKLIVKRRLASNDYKNSKLQNDQKIFGNVNWQSPKSELNLTRKNTGRLLNNPNVAAGGVLIQDLSNSIIETITIPTPQFVTLQYEIKIWTSYTTHMNQISEQLFASYLPNDRAIKLISNKGYWFIAYIEGDGFQQDGNQSSVGSEERLIKATLQLKVPAYIIATNNPGQTQTTRSTFSNPDISFEIPEVNENNIGLYEEPFLGADNPELPRTVQTSNRRIDKREDFSGPIGKTFQQDPARTILRRGQKLPLYKKNRNISISKINDRYIRSRSINTAVGETAYDGFELSEFELAVG
jgi:hypothetical protein